MNTPDASGPAIRPLTLEEVVRAALTDSSMEFRGNTKKLADLPTRFPVQVDQQTRVFLEYHAQALGTSIASLSGLILKQVVNQTLANAGIAPMTHTPGRSRSG
jgi:hypothetical protein